MSVVFLVSRALQTLDYSPNVCSTPSYTYNIITIKNLFGMAQRY